MSKRILMVMLALLTMGAQAFAQGISGRVTDTVGEAVIGAGVVVKGTTNGTVTDINGNYSLANVQQGTVVVFSCVGYASQEVVVGSSKVVNVVLKEDSTFLDEVVVVAYGTQKRKDLTGSLTDVKSDLIAIQNTTTVSRALEGAAPGIQVSSVDGQPGYDMAIRLRGTSSTNGGSAAALIVIDGVPQQTNGTYENPLSQLNPEDIANVTVLKDAASTALYGSRAANGVVLITTKGGQEGRAKISFQGRWGWNSIGNYNTNSIDTASEYYEYLWQSLYNSYRYGVDGTGLPGTNADGTYFTNVNNPNCSDEEARLFASAHLFDYDGSNTNFQKNVLGNNLAYRVPGAIYTQTGSGTNASATMSGAYLVDPATGRINPDAELLYNDNGSDAVLQTAFRQEYNISASGGTEKMKYYASFGYQNDPSYLLGTGFQRYSGRVNLDAQITKWLKMGANVGFSKTKTNSQSGKWGSRQIGGANGNAMLWIKGWQPIVPLYTMDANGDVVLDDNGDKLLNIKSASYSPLGTASSAFSSDYAYNAKTNLDQQDIVNWTTRVYGNVHFLKYFDFRATFNMDMQNHERSIYVNNKYGRTSYGFGGIKTTDRWLINTQQILSYNQDFGEHHVDAMVGHEYEDLSKKYLNYGSGMELISGIYKPGNFISRFACVDGGENAPSPGWSLENTYRIESYLARLNYNYNQKYYFSASFRADGSSRFLPDYRWGKFWSVGGSWRMSEEDFMAGTKDYLDNLKIRASYGITGNANGISIMYPYAYYTYGAASWTSSTGGSGTPASTSISYKNQTDLGVDPTLTWEKVHQFDAGVDFSFFKSRLTGAIDFYNNNTVNSFFAQTVSPLASVGKTSKTSNAAVVRNRGFEIELDADIIRTKDLTLSIGINGTHYRTRLMDVPDDQIPNWDETMDVPEGCWSVSTEDMAQAGTAGHAGRGIFYLRGEGKDLFNLYMPKYAGVDEYGLPTYWHRVTYYDVNKKEDGTYDHGGRYINYKQGDDVVTNVAADASNYEVGSATPDWIGGIQINLRWKNFDLSLNGAYQFGGKFFSMEYSQHLYRTSTFGLTNIPVSKSVVGKTWTPSNTGASYPMQWFPSSTSKSMYLDGSLLPGSHNYTDMSLFDATYFRLKNITVGYTLPKKITDKVNISNLRIFASADNVLLFSGAAGLDPSMSVIGGKEVDTYVYPQMQTFTIGVNLDF